MNHPLRKRRPVILWLLLGVALAFGLLVHFYPSLSGSDEINGLGGVCLGLLIAAFPAANFLDMLLSELGAARWRSLRRADLPWAALNLLVLLAGLIVVVEGARLFYAHWQPG
jgi:hypothetical protein